MDHHHSAHHQKAVPVYTCPMHPEIKQDAPGICPKCGMNLELKGKGTTHIEGKDATQKKIPESGIKQEKSTKYVCPMHPQIVQDGPGSCPICGMDLVPLVKSKTDDPHKVHHGGIDDFKRRFFVVLVLTVPIMLLSEMIQHWLNFSLSFPGSKFVLLGLSSVVFLWWLAIFKGLVGK